jgi:signal transduction histidine kinase
MMSDTPVGQSLFKNRKKSNAALCCLIAIFIIGDVDFLTGYRISLLTYYILPIGFAVIYVGPAFAASLAILSIAISVSTDFWAGMPLADAWFKAWNVTIALSVYFIVIGLLYELSRFTRRLESSIQQKTKDLLREMSERGRLEREIIDLSERQQRRFGQELHDVVCQELTGVAIAAHLLVRKLAAAEHEEMTHARELAYMADHALETTRSVARGFFTAGFDGAGLAEALREMARRVESQNHIVCVVRWEEKLTITNEDIVIHLFRVAQEAVHNAVKHAGASRIEVSLKLEKEMLELVIEDDGKGLPPPKERGKGLGLRIMAHRAGLIGAEFKMEHPDRRGTRAVCRVPIDKLQGPVVEAAR